MESIPHHTIMWLLVEWIYNGSLMIYHLVDINGYEGICHWYIDGMQSNMIVSRWDTQGDSNWKLLAVCLLGVLAQVVPLEFAWNSGKKRRAGIWVIGWWGHIYIIFYIYIYEFNIR